MIYTKDSIISFTPAPDQGWIADFTAEPIPTKPTEPFYWSEIVIGWAVVVSWVGTNEDVIEPGSGMELMPMMETTIEPVVLADDQHPVTVRRYLDGHSKAECLCITRKHSEEPRP